MDNSKKTTVVRKKRKYSKLGCNECKKRKVKCDEQKPECWQCSHLGKKCVYSQPSNGPPYKSVKFINASSENIHSIHSIYGPNDNFNANINDNINDNFNDNFNSNFNANFNTNTNTSANANVHINNTNKLDNHDDNTNDEIKKPPGNQNQISPVQHQGSLHLDDKFPGSGVTSILNDATILANELVTSMVDPPTVDSTIAGEHIESILSAQNTSTSWENISKELFMVSELELYYLRVFYHKVAFWIMPFACSPSENICNELLFDLMIKINKQEGSQSSCLQSAVVSISAKYLYNTTKLREHDAIRRSFLKKTVTQLTSEFDSMPQDHLLELKIESLIICVLILTLDSSSFKTNEMRIHLHGASALLRKYEGLRDQGTSQFGEIMRSKCLLLSKAWFTATETVAFLSLVGTVSEGSVIDDMFTLGVYSSNESILKQMRILYPNGYNTFLGYSNEVMNQFKMVMKYFNSPNQTDSYNDKFFQLMVQTDAARSFKFVDNEFARIRVAGELLSSYPESCYVVHNTKSYSAFDAMQQGTVECTFIFFCMVYLELPLHCPMIQNSARRIWDFFSWIFKDDKLDVIIIEKLMNEIEFGYVVTYDQFTSKGLNLASKLIIPEMLFDFRGLMYQSTLLVCGTLLQSDDTISLRIIRAKILAFVECLIENLGAESGKSSLELLFKRWCLLKEGKSLTAKDCLKNEAALPFS